ncbi:TetR/AcrR family transcriptional regulator [Mycobacterium sp.]|uniref:TetR/AcrR family transcriptional regulator n=1 Tax=Mycobacterium sp. TaxID=1785 RepID=UPI002CEC1EAF|nr:TetR/AcrR family transcriptional regulator [Mycobacterium sp.]HTQ16860.1 TetR/AcrR family transcriptional regulator [Mycobacterium sp.]
MNRLERRKQEVRERILGAAFELFLRKGVAATTIEEICEQADVANRTFFNHFATRQDMVRALAERRLVNLHDVVFDRSAEPIPARLIGVFDDIAAALVKSGDTYREMIREMLATSGFGIQGTQRGSNLHDTFVELVKEGVARGEVGAHRDAETLADIIVGALSGGIVNWTADRTYSLPTNLHNLGVALAELLTLGVSHSPSPTIRTAGTRRSRPPTRRPR